MTSFDHVLSIVLAHEGGLVDDPHDPGGITNFGISIKFAGSVNLDIDGDGKTTGEDIRALTLADASELYLDHFWRPLRCAEMPPGVALMVFDGGVNQGRTAMAKRLQRAVGAADDGVIGPKTLAALDRHHNDYAGLINEVAARRGRRYAQTRNFDRYGLGWMRRLMAVHGRALSLQPP
jgi:lysozyme family protein